MACTIILRPSFAGLLAHLKVSLETVGGRDPLVPKWIVTPNKTAAAYLRAELAGRDEPLFGARILPLPTFTQRLLSSFAESRSPRWSPLLDLMLFELVHRIPDSSPLGALKYNPLGHHLVRPALRDLADAGLGDSPRALEALVEDSTSGTTDRAFLDLFVSWLRLLEAGKLPWEPLSIQELSEELAQLPAPDLRRVLGSERDQEPCLFIYGFYDFTDVNLSLLTGLALRFPVHLYLPALPGHANESVYAFSAGVFEDLKARLPEGEFTVDRSEEFSPREQYFLSTFPDGPIDRMPGFLSVQAASGTRAEALSAAVRVATWLREEALEPEDVLVLAPDLTRYYETVAELFSDFRIPLKVADFPLEGAGEHRSLQTVKTLWKGRAPLEWLLSYLREFPRVLGLRGVDLDHFERALRELPFSGGPAWERLSELLTDEGTVGSVSRPVFTAAEMDFIREIAALWSLPESLQIGEALPFLEKLRDWLEKPEWVDPLIEAVSWLSEVRPNLSIPSEVITEGLPEPGTYSDDLHEPGVLLTSFMRGRGLTAKAVVVLGLSSDQFPPRFEEDPFLSDRMRLRLARGVRDIGHRLSAKSQSSDEMSLLFFLINTSAERLHWVVPETDDGGKKVAPSPWILRYLHRWTRGGSEPLSRIPRAPLEQARYLYSLDPAGGFLLPPEHAVLLDPSLDSSPQRAALEETEDPTWAGLIPPEEPRRDELSRISVSRLQELARCPFRFWAGSLRRLEAVSVKTPLEEIDARARGSFLHEFLEALLEPSLASRKSIAEVAAELLKAESDHRDAQITIPETILSRLQLTSPMMRRAELRRLLRITTRYLRYETIHESGRRRVLAQEKLLSRPLPGLPGVEIVGKIDRVDRTASGTAMIDYKSGKKPWASATARRHELELGFHLQPSLYPWLYSGSENARHDFHYVFLGEDPPVYESVEERVDLVNFFASLCEVLTAGSYLATSNELLVSLGIEAAKPCRYCQFGSLCRRSDPGHIGRNLPLLKGFAPLRFESFQRGAIEEAE